jgi:hypothetical protein
LGSRWGSRRVFPVRVPTLCCRLGFPVGSPVGIPGRALRLSPRLGFSGAGSRVGVFLPTGFLFPSPESLSLSFVPCRLALGASRGASSRFSQPCSQSRLPNWRSLLSLAVQSFRLAPSGRHSQLRLPGPSAAPYALPAFHSLPAFAFRPGCLRHSAPSPGKRCLEACSLAVLPSLFPGS